MSERKSSIHINPVKSTSEQHNNRDQELDYVFPEHTHENEQWVGELIADREKTIKRLCKQISGRKMQKNAEPIREGVVNLQSHHTMEDLQKLKSDLANMVYTEGKYEGQKKWRFEIIQMHIHKDEGVAIKIEKKEGESEEEYKERVDKEPKKLDPERVNYHAHLVFDWQDKENGKMLRYARGQMADLQTDVANSLGMQRGKERTADKRTANERLEPVEYKVKQRGKELVELQSEISVLEQKKNEAESRFERDSREAIDIGAQVRKLENQSKDGIRDIRAGEEQWRKAERDRREREKYVYEKLMGDPEGVGEFSEEEIKRAIVLAQGEIDREDELIKRLKAEDRN